MTHVALKLPDVQYGKDTMMKTLKSNMRTVAAYSSADDVNAEDFPAWTLSDDALLDPLSRKTEGRSPEECEQGANS